MRFGRGVVGLSLALLVWFFLLVPPAAGHETREVGGYQVVAGWAEEPVFAGFKNAVSVRVRSGAQGVEGLQLRVEILFGDKDATERKGPLDLSPAANDARHYLAPIIPTRPGRYTFHVTGMIGPQAFDEFFTSGESTFDEVIDPRLLQFPVRDPSVGELGTKSDRAVARSSDALEIARTASDDSAVSRVLGFAGAGVGLLGLAIATVALRRSSRK